METEGWVVFLGPCPRSEAGKRFEEWKLDRESRGLPVPLDRIRIDHLSMGPGGGGCHLRYSLPKDLLA